MKVNYFIISCLLAISGHCLQAQTYPPTPQGAEKPGWTYVGGDEFNGTQVDPSLWGIYGAPGVGEATFNQKNASMLQTYRPDQISFLTLPTSEKVLRIKSIKGNGAPAPVSWASGSVPAGTIGWWSGALSSRDAQNKKYYPLYARFEIRARTPYLLGVWNALWCRFNKESGGSDIAELDMNEFFLKEAQGSPVKYMQPPVDPATPIVAQTLHLYDENIKKVHKNIIGNNWLNRWQVIDSDPGANFHVYGVQVMKDPEDDNHAIITFLLDGKETYSINTRYAFDGKTDEEDRFNSFIRKAKANPALLNSAWDIAITGQIGGLPNYVGYPESTLSQVDFDVDWVRVYVPEAPKSQPTSYQHLIMYGQSLSTGAQSYPVISTANVPGNYMIGDQVWTWNGNRTFTEFKPLLGTVAFSDAANPKTKDAITLAETPLLGLTNHLQKKQSGTNYLATACGVNGKSIEELSKELNWNGTKDNLYTNYFLKSITDASNVAATKGYTVTCPAIFWLQGEYNYDNNANRGLTTNTASTQDKAKYKELLVTLKNNMQSDIKSKYRQATNPVFITYQTGAQYTRGNDVAIGMAQLEASNENTDIICSGPVYQMTDRGGHLDANGYRWYGEMMAKVYYQTQIEKKEFKPLQPKRIFYSKTDNKLRIQFHVPKLPLVLDEKTLPKQTDYGFVVKNNGVQQTISSINIENDNLVITCASALTGVIDVIYAGAAGIGHGNLRDSDDYPSFYTYVDLDGKNGGETYIYPRVSGSLRPVDEPKDANGAVIYGKLYPLYNFSVAFYYKLDANTSSYIVPGFSGEFTKLYVKKGGTGDGSSWDSPLGEVADAIKIAQDRNAAKIDSVKEIWVAKGTYTPKYRADNMSGANASDRHNAFALPKDLKIYGGFSGNESTLSQRDWNSNPTLLSGDFKGDDGADFSGNSENAYHVVVSSGDVGTTVLDGFNISGGNANAASSITSSINGRTFYACDGGGINVFASSPAIANVKLSGNYGTSGGGLFVRESVPVLINVAIYQNKAYSGGGVVNKKSDIRLTNVAVYSNTSTTNGGIYFEDSSSPILTNLTIANNQAGSGAGVNNVRSNPKIYNTIVWGNTPSNVSNTTSTPDYNYSLVGAVTTNDAKGNIAGSTNPLFVNSAAGNNRLQGTSPVINKGNNSYLANVTADLDGSPRIVSTTVDLGTYEYQGVILKSGGSATGLELSDENLQKQITVYPNPVKAGQQLHFKVSQDHNSPLTMVLYNISGELIKSMAVSSGEVSFTAPEIPGMYIVKLIHGEKVSGDLKILVK